MRDLDLKAIWQAAAEQPSPPCDIEQIIEQTHAFESKIRRRNAIEWLAALALVVWCGSDLIGAELGLLLLGDVILIAGALGICLYLWRHGRTERLPDPALDSRAFIESQARSLDKQATLLKKTPLWYVGPLALGAGISLVGQALERGSVTSAWLVASGIVVAVFAGVIAVNLRGARKLRAKAAALRSELD